MQFLHNAVSPWLGEIIFGDFVLVCFVLVVVGCWALKFNLWGFVIWRHFLHGCFGLYFVFGEVVFVAWGSVERYLGSLVGCLWYWFGLDFGWFNELRFIRGYSLKLDRRTVILGWHGSILRLEDIAIVLGILYWFNGVGLVLIFVWALADEGNLIQYFTLKLNDSYSITFKLWRRVYEIVNFLWHVSILITGFKGFWVVMPLLVFILRNRTTGGRYFDILIMISIGSRKIAFYSRSGTVMLTYLKKQQVPQVQSSQTHLRVLLCITR